MRISAREACVKPHLRTRSDIIVYYATRAYSITLRTSDECAPIARVCKEVRPSCICYFMQFCVESSI